jgi:hypothetical protein
MRNVLRTTATAGFLLASAASSTEACSLVGMAPYRYAGNVYFTAIATADTVLAGPGARSLGEGPGHSGRGTPRPIFGQVVRVQRLANGSPTVLSSALTAAADEVVIVPWDYGPDCSPVTWSDSFRWMTPGTGGLYSARLRDQEHWVGGRPTFDATAALTPYPSAPLIRTYLERSGLTSSPDSMPMLSPDELLTYYEATPSGMEAQSVAELTRSAEDLRRWRDANPTIARRRPAADLIEAALRQIAYTIGNRRMRDERSPFAGTYRLTITLAGGDSFVFHARTETSPTSRLTYLDRRRTGIADTALSGPEGYYLLLVGSGSADSLPLERSGSEPQGYFAVASSSLIATGDSTVRRGSADVFSVASQLTADSTLAAQLQRINASIGRMISTGESNFAPGRFIQKPDGSIRFEEVIRENGKILATVRAERISPVHLTPQ